MKKREYYSKRQKQQKETALQRIRELFAQAEKTKDQKLRDRYSALAHKLVLKYKVKLPRNLKRKYCKYCKTFWISGKTVRIRIGKKTISFTCLVCRKIKRLVKTT